MSVLLIIESDTSKQIMEELKGSGIYAQEVSSTDLIKGEIGSVDSGIRFVDVCKLPPAPRRPRVQPSYRSLLKNRY